jgi:hypothetical protein
MHDRVVRVLGLLDIALGYFNGEMESPTVTQPFKKIALLFAKEEKHATSTTFIALTPSSSFRLENMYEFSENVVSEAMEETKQVCFVFSPRM